MRVMVRNDNYPGHNKDLIERLNQQYGYAKDVKKYFDLKQTDDRDFAGTLLGFRQKENTRKNDFWCF